MAKCNLCNRNMSITKEGVYRAHTVHKDSKEVCQNSGMPAPDWYTENQIKKQVMGETYQDYLQTEHWKDISEEAKRLAGYRCQLCNAEGELHTHHRTYERKGRELQSDLIVLCSICHSRFHEDTQKRISHLERINRRYKVLTGTLSSFRNNPSAYSEQVREKLVHLLGENLLGEFDVNN